MYYFLIIFSTYQNHSKRRK